MLFLQRKLQLIRAGNDLINLWWIHKGADFGLSNTFFYKNNFGPFNINLAHFYLMEFISLITWSNSFEILGLFGRKFQFHSICLKCKVQLNNSRFYDFS